MLRTVRKEKRSNNRRSRDGLTVTERRIKPEEKKVRLGGMNRL